MTDYSLSAGTGSFVFAGNTVQIGKSAEIDESIFQHDVLANARGFVISQGIGAHDAISYAAYPAAIINEVIKLQPTQANSLTFGLTTTDIIQLAQSISIAYPQLVSEGIGAHDALSTILGVLVLERLNIASSAIAVGIFGQSVVELVKLNDAVSRFFGATIADGLGLHDGVTNYWFPTAVVSEHVGLHDLLGTSMVFRLDLKDGVDFDDANIAQMIFSQTVGEGMVLSAAYVSPDGNFTAWAMNTRTGAVTEYQNWRFNSFAKIGNKYLGANSQGIFELNGQQDGSANIVATIRSGLAQFGGSRFSAIRAVYMAMRGEGEVYFKLIDGDGVERVYSTIVKDMRTTKIDLGKGLRSRYYAFELQTIGQDFDLESIEFIPLTMQRRI